MANPLPGPPPKTGWSASAVTGISSSGKFPANGVYRVVGPLRTMGPSSARTTFGAKPLKYSPGLDPKNVENTPDAGPVAAPARAFGSGRLVAAPPPGAPVKRAPGVVGMPARWESPAT